jgi:hypothetical protein
MIAKQPRDRVGHVRAKEETALMPRPVRVRRFADARQGC